MQTVAPFDRQTDTQVTKTLNDWVIGLNFLVKFRVAIYHGQRMISQSKEWACERHLDDLQILSTQLIKVAQYSFSGSTPPKFEHKLRRHKKRFGKIATTVVLNKEGNLLWSGLQWHRSCHSNEITPLPIYLQQYLSALGAVLPKSFTRAFSSNSRLDVREV